MVVDEILDVTEEAVTVRQGSDRKGLLGSAVVGKQVTDFLDLNEVIRATGGNWFQGTDGQRVGRGSWWPTPRHSREPWSAAVWTWRAMWCSKQPIWTKRCSKLEQQPVDVVLAALDLPPGGCSALLAAMRHRPEWEKIPVLALADSAEQVQAAAARTAGFEDCLAKFDRALVLESVAKLVSPPASLRRWHAAGVEEEEINNGN